QLEDIATQYFGIAVSNYRLDDLARDINRFLNSGAVADLGNRMEVEKAAERLRERTRVFFDELKYSHQIGVRGDARMRVSSSSLADSGHGAALLTGALDLVESTVALLPKPAPDQDSGVAEQIATLSRRAREIRDELRFLMRAGDPTYVYFIECRGKGVFL